MNTSNHITTTNFRYKSVEALTTLRVSPQYYQKVCSQL